MLPTYFISHGGGPWPYIEDMRKMFGSLEQSLHNIPEQLISPSKAVLMISGHWEQSMVSVTSNPWPGMEYDYHGFPEHTYSIQYPAPGSPALALRIQALLQTAGFAVSLDPDKGFDHGAFTPMAIMYPEANVPLLQISLKTGLDPSEHLSIGRALRPLREEGVLIIGSGLSYHNLRLLGPAGRIPSQAFDDWLQTTLIESQPNERLERLTHWTNAPYARKAHPREDHLIPLMMAVGAAESSKAICCYHEKDVFDGITCSSFRFDD